MNSTVKVCKKHGELTKDQIYHYGYSGKLCKPCQTARTKKWRKKNKEYCNKKQKEWREKNIEKAKETKKKSYIKYHDKNIKRNKEGYQKNKTIRQEYAKINYHKDRSRMANSRLKRLFGISLDQYNEMVSKQNNCCAICNLPERLKDNKQLDIRKLSVDHCHLTNKVRGLLCFNCNIVLGKFNDSIEMFEKAIKYLKSHQF